MGTAFFFIRGQDGAGKAYTQNTLVISLVAYTRPSSRVLPCQVVMFADIQNVHHMSQLLSGWPAADIFTESTDGDIDTVHFWNWAAGGPTNGGPPPFYAGTVDLNHVEVIQ